MTRICLTRPPARVQGNLCAPSSAQCYNRSTVQLLSSRNVARKARHACSRAIDSSASEAQRGTPSRRRFPGARFKLHSAETAARGFVQRTSFQNPRVSSATS